MIRDYKHIVGANAIANGTTTEHAHNQSYHLVLMAAIFILVLCGGMHCIYKNRCKRRLPHSQGNAGNLMIDLTITRVDIGNPSEQSPQYIRIDSGSSGSSIKTENDFEQELEIVCIE